MDRRTFLAGGAAAVVGALCPQVVEALAPPILEQVVEVVASFEFTPMFAEFTAPVTSSGLTMAMVSDAIKTLREMPMPKPMYVLSQDGYAALEAKSGWWDPEPEWDEEGAL